MTDCTLSCVMSAIIQRSRGWRWQVASVREARAHAEEGEKLSYRLNKSKPFRAFVSQRLQFFLERLDARVSLAKLLQHGRC